MMNVASTNTTGSSLVAGTTTAAADPVDTVKVSHTERIATLQSNLKEVETKRETTQEQIKSCQNKLSKLFRHCPDKPRDTIAEMDQRVVTLERERETTSMTLQKEKAILAQIHKLQLAKGKVTEFEQCDQQIKAAKNEVAELRQALRALNTDISALRVELSMTQLAQQLGCRVQDLLGIKINCPADKLGQVIGRKGKNVQQLAGQANVSVDIVKNSSSSSKSKNGSSKSKTSGGTTDGQVRLVGAMSSLDKAVLDLDRVMSTTQERFQVPPENIQYWTAKGIHALEDIRSSHPDVFIDVPRNNSSSSKNSTSTKSNNNNNTVVLLRGIPADLASVKQDLLATPIIRHEWQLSNKEGSLVVGKQGSTIGALVLSHQTVIHVQRVGSSSSDDEKDKNVADGDNNDSNDNGNNAKTTNGSDSMTTIQVLGPSGHVQAAVREIQNLLQANREIENSIPVDPYIKNTLLLQGGKGMQALFQKVNAAVKDPSVGMVSVNLGPNPQNTILVKGKARVMDEVVEVVEAELRRLEHNMVRFQVDPVVIPVLIGKRGKAVNDLIGDRKTVNVEFDQNSGTVIVCGLDESDVQGVVQDIHAKVNDHKVTRIPLDSAQFRNQIRELLRTKSKEINALVFFKVDDDKCEIVIRGSDEHLETAGTMIREFLDKNYIQELEASEEDLTALLTGGKNCKIVDLAKETGVKLNTDRDRLVVVARGEKEVVSKAIATVRQFLFGGEGIMLARVPIEASDMATVIGKGGKTKADLQKKYPDLSIIAHRNENAFSLRGPEQDVKACRVDIQKLIATAWTSKVLELTTDQVEMITKTRLHRRIMQTIPARIVPENSTITIRGTKDDVRDAAALIHDRIGIPYKTGYYLESSFFVKVKDSWRDPAHVKRMENSSGAKIQLDAKQSVILFSGKQSSVRKAKAEVLKFFSFAFSSLFLRVDHPGPLLTSLGKSGSIAEVAAGSGARVILDRDINTILIFSSDANRVQSARDILKAKIENEQKLVHVIQLDASEDWLVSLILGKNGKNITSLRKETGCNIEVVSPERRLTISAATEDLVAKAKASMDEIIAKARMEHAVVPIPEKDMAAFVGKSGTRIKEFEATHQVQVQVVKKGQSGIRITGKDVAVLAAKNAIAEFTAAREERRTQEQATDTVKVMRDQVPRVIGNKGDVIRGLQRQFGCKVDVNRRTCVVTVQGSKRAAAIKRIQEIVSEEPETEKEGVETEKEAEATNAGEPGTPTKPVEEEEMPPETAAAETDSTSKVVVKEKKADASPRAPVPQASDFPALSARKEPETGKEEVETEKDAVATIAGEPGTPTKPVEEEEMPQETAAAETDSTSKVVVKEKEEVAPRAAVPQASDLPALSERKEPETEKEEVETEKETEATNAGEPGTPTKPVEEEEMPPETAAAETDSTSQVVVKEEKEEAAPRAPVPQASDFPALSERKEPETGKEEVETEKETEATIAGEPGTPTKPVEEEEMPQETAAAETDSTSQVVVKEEKEEAAPRAPVPQASDFPALSERNTTSTGENADNESGISTTEEKIVVRSWASLLTKDEENIATVPSLAQTIDSIVSKDELDDASCAGSEQAAMTADENKETQESTVL